MTGIDRSRTVWTSQNRLGQVCAGQDRLGHVETCFDRLRQLGHVGTRNEKTGQDKTGQDRSATIAITRKLKN